MEDALHLVSQLTFDSHFALDWMLADLLLALLPIRLEILNLLHHLDSPDDLDLASA